MTKIAYEVHIGDTAGTGPIESREEAIQMIEKAGEGMLLSMVEETEYYPVLSTRWRTSAGWGYGGEQWYAIDMHGWEGGKQPVLREEVG